METTLDISDDLLREAEEKAARDGTTLVALVERGLQSVLKLPENLKVPEKAETYRLEIKPFKGNGLQPGIKSLHWDDIGHLVYDEEDRFR